MQIHPTHEDPTPADWERLTEEFFGKVLQLRAALQNIAMNGADMGGAWCAAQATKTLSE